MTLLGFGSEGNAFAVPTDTAIEDVLAIWLKHLLYRIDRIWERIA